MTSRPGAPYTSRRDVLLAGAAGLLALGTTGLPLGRTGAAESIIVADPGGPFKDGYGAAFYRPYEKEAGITIVNIAREHQPTSQVRAIVETKNYSWDVVTSTQG